MKPGRSTTLLVVAAVGVLVALAIGDALRSGRSSSAADTARKTTPAPTTETTSPPNFTPMAEVARTPNTCGAFRIAPSGDYPLLVVEVVAGNVTCHDARRVMKSHYVGLHSGSWICHGPEGSSGCEKPSRERSARTSQTHSTRNGGWSGSPTVGLGPSLRQTGAASAT